jgi:hypothetical protein
MDIVQKQDSWEIGLANPSLYYTHCGFIYR